MSTLATVVDRALNTYLRSTFRARFNTLANDLTADATDFTLNYELDQLGDGSLLAIDNEVMHVLAVNRAAKLLTVARGVHGSNAVTHDADDVVEINPRYPRYLVREAMRATVVGWPDSVFWTEPVALTTTATEWSVRVDSKLTGTDVAPIVGLMRLQRQDRNNTSYWHRVRGWRPEPDLVEAGSWHVVLDDAAGVADTYRVIVARRFDVSTSWSDSTDLAVDVKLPRSLEEALELGAAWRLLTGKETLRLQFDAEGESRVPDEVKEGQTARFAAQVMALHDRRLNAEAMRLALKWGVEERTHG